MKIIIRALETKVDVQEYVSAEIDPEWRHTSQRGTVYRYDRAEEVFVPAPSEVRVVHVDCPDPEVCGGCDGWDETHYIDDAGDRFIPGTRPTTRFFSGRARTSGWCVITEATREEIEALMGLGEDGQGGDMPPSMIRFDDPRVVWDGMRTRPTGEFWITQVKIEGKGKQLVAQADFLANIEEGKK
jgi:hypothetical protein